MTNPLSRRKDEHLDLCATGDVGFKGRGTLLSDLQLVHDALPELALNEIDASVSLFGKTLRAPLLIAGMTGGTDRAREINRALAEIAEKRGYAFGLGSQRAMQKAPGSTPTYEVRDVAPRVLLLGNIGVIQARDLPTEEIARLVETVRADALCVHMNPAMELVQNDGDRDFRGGIATFSRLASELRVPIIAKETGCGLGPRTAEKLYACGVRHVDVSGAGGTSWVGVETLRADPETRSLGQSLWNWGVPTAASVAINAKAGMTVFATGGIQQGLEAAHAIALGATLVGIARPVLRAYTEGGADAVDRFFDQIETELRAVMLLTGSRTIADLQRAPRLITGELAAWIARF